ncbi:hypothetical protein Tco_0071331 [Tanacetum coccineum]
MVQQVIPTAQLVPRLHTIGRCNNYAVLQSIPCSPECKIIGQILLDHPLSYALTAIADVPVVYLQQFGRTVSKVPGPEDTIKFMMNTQEFVYTVDMFRDILHLPVETPENPFVAPVNIETIEAFMHKVGYQGVVDKINILHLFHAVINRTNVDYVALLWWDFMNNIPQRIEEDYHSIKDDILLVSVYTIGDVCVRRMLIPNEFLTEEICAIDDFKEYETVFMNGKKRKQSARESRSPMQSHNITVKRKKQSTPSIPPPKDDQERDEIAEVTLLSLTLHKTALAAKAQENITKVQEKLAEEEIEKIVEGDKDEESYASEFADSILNDDVDDSGTRLRKRRNDIEIEKEKKDDKVIEKEKKDKEIEKDKNNDIVEETDKVVKEKDIVDDVTSISEELTATVSPTTATTSKASSTTKHKKQSNSFRSKTLPGSIAGMCRRCGLIRSHIKNKFVTHDFFMRKICKTLNHCNKVVPALTFAKTKEMIVQEMPCLVNLAVTKDREVDPINAKDMIAKEFATHGPKMIEELFRKHMQHTTLNLYPTTSSSTAGKSSAGLQYHLYLNMKTNPQDQAADAEI